MTDALPSCILFLCLLVLSPLVCYPARLVSNKQVEIRAQLEIDGQTEEGSVQQPRDAIEDAHTKWDFDQQRWDLDKAVIKSAKFAEEPSVAAAAAQSVLESSSALQNDADVHQEGEMLPGVLATVFRRWNRAAQAHDGDTDEDLSSLDDYFSNTESEDSFSSGDDSETFSEVAQTSESQMVAASRDSCFEVVAEICPGGYREGADKAQVVAAVRRLVNESDAKAGFVWDIAKPVDNGWITRAYFVNQEAFKHHITTDAWRNMLQVSNAACNSDTYRLYMPKCKGKVGLAQCWTGAMAQTCPSEKAVLTERARSLSYIDFLRESPESNAMSLEQWALPDDEAGRETLLFHD